MKNRNGNFKYNLNYVNKRFTSAKIAVLKDPPLQKNPNFNKRKKTEDQKWNFNIFYKGFKKKQENEIEKKNLSIIISDGLKEKKIKNIINKIDKLLK